MNNDLPLQSTAITPICSSVHQPDLPVTESLFGQFVTVVLFAHALEPQTNDSVTKKIKKTLE